MCRKMELLGSVMMALGAGLLLSLLMEYDRPSVRSIL